MLEKLYAGGVRKIFCGHYHRNAGGWFKVSLGGTMIEITAIVTNYAFIRTWSAW